MYDSMTSIIVKFCEIPFLTVYNLLLLAQQAHETTFGLLSNSQPFFHFCCFFTASLHRPFGPTIWTLAIQNIFVHPIGHYVSTHPRRMAKLFLPLYLDERGDTNVFVQLEQFAIFRLLPDYPYIFPLEFS